MICNTFVANTTGVDPLKLAAVNLSMFDTSAEAKMSAGAPCTIWACKAEDASKLNVTFASGCAVVNAAPRSLKAAVSDDAANTVMSPFTAGTVVGAAVVGAAVVGARVVGARVVGAAVVGAAAVVIGGVVVAAN